MTRVGDQIPLQLQLFDGATGKFPRAVVKDASGAAISGSPFDLAHVANGHYSNLSAVMPSTPFVTIQYLVYSDAGHTTLDTGYSAELDVQEQDNSLPTASYTAPDNATITAIAGYVDTEVAAIKAKTDLIPASPASETTLAAVKAKTDNLPADPASETNVNLRLPTASYTAPDNSTIAAIAGYVDTEVAAIKAKTDNLPSDPADNSDILAAIAGISVPTPPTVGAIADAVWDEPLASHVGAGSTGEKLNAGATVNVQDIVDGVWNEPMASHLTAGTTGKKLNDGGSGGGGGASLEDISEVVQSALAEPLVGVIAEASESELISEIEEN